MDVTAIGSIKQESNSNIFVFCKDTYDNIVEIRLGSKKDCKKGDRIGLKQERLWEWRAQHGQSFLGFLET